MWNGNLRNVRVKENQGGKKEDDTNNVRKNEQQRRLCKVRKDGSRWYVRKSQKVKEYEQVGENKKNEESNIEEVERKVGSSRIKAEEETVKKKRKMAAGTKVCEKK